MSKHNKQLDFENDFREEEAPKAVEKETAVVEDIQDEMVENSNGDRTLSRDDIIAVQYKAGYPLKQIVKEHGIAYGTVYHVLARKGVPLRSNTNNSKSNRRLREMSKLEKQSLVLDYREGMPNADIYRKYNINKHGCYILLDEMGVSRRRDVADFSENIGAKNTPTQDEVDLAISDIVEDTVKKVKENKKSNLDMEVNEETILTEVEQVGDTLNITIMKDSKNTIKNVNVSFVD